MGPSVVEGRGFLLTRVLYPTCFTFDDTELWVLRPWCRFFLTAAVWAAGKQSFVVILPPTADAHCNRIN